MIKPVVCAALLACSFGALAADWQKDFFSPLSHELPPSRGVAADALGNVHLQTYNRFSGSEQYVFLHHYIIDASGQTQPGWGLSQVERMSDCGVYAKAGQRLDCTRRNGVWGEETRLEMYGSDGPYPVWQNTLPGEATLLDASIPQQDHALVLARIDSPIGAELGVFRVQSNAPAEPLSVIPACPQPNQSVLNLRARMPQQPWEPLRVVKACWNSFGTTDLILDEFDPQSGQWNTRSLWSVPFGAALMRAEIGPQGQPYALIQHESGTRELLTAPQFIDQWMPVPFPIQDKIAAFLVGERGLTVVSVGSSQANGMNATLGGEYTVSWFEAQSFWPIMHRFEELDAYAPKVFALSSEGELLVLGSLLYQSGEFERLLLAQRSRELHQIADVTLSANETARGAPYLLGGPNNTAVLARTIAQEQSAFETWLGVRANSYDLPPSFK